MTDRANFNSENLVRRVVFTPYRPGMGPRFTLQIFATNRTRGGKDVLAYRLTQARVNTNRFDQTPGQGVVFEGADFGNSPMHAIDSDATVVGLMSFLTLRPGDTDAEYFANYTERQRDFASEHAESLSAEVESRFPGHR
jgi:hypothetical protein